MHNPPDDVIQLRDVTFGYGQTTVLRDVSVGLAAGRVTAVIGPNAAGKSTLTGLMLGLLQPWQGSVTLQRRDLSTYTPTQRAVLLSYVPQRGAASFAFTVRQVVAMGRFAHRSDPGAVAAALQATDLAPLADRVFAHLSGGQQQQVLIARAMAQSTGGGVAILLDEPTSNLDLRHIHDLMGRLRERAAAGLAVLVVLHDLNLAARYADDVWLLQQGRLVSAGPWQDVLDADRLTQVYRLPLQRVDRPSGRPVFVAEPVEMASAPGGSGDQG